MSRAQSHARQSVAIRLVASCHRQVEAVPIVSELDPKRMPANEASMAAEVADACRAMFVSDSLNKRYRCRRACGVRATCSKSPLALNVQRTPLPVITSSA